jgi:hypothetical protein
MSSAPTEALMSDERDALLRDAYQGEVFGEAFFATLAAQETDRDRIDKLRALERIEAQTAATLSTYAESERVDVGGNDESRHKGEELAAVAMAAGWDPFVRGLHDALPSFLAGFVRLREVAPNPRDAALAELVAHELAINAFAELELAGHGDLAAAVLRRYLEESAPVGSSPR